MASFTKLIRRGVRGFPFPKSSILMLLRTASGMHFSPPNMSAIVLRKRLRTRSFAVFMSSVRANGANIPL